MRCMLTGWLEPLLDRIGRNPTTVVCPLIETINDDTLEIAFTKTGQYHVGGFGWNLQVSFVYQYNPWNEYFLH